jgi:hypothetical protein
MKRVESIHFRLPNVNERWDDNQEKLIVKILVPKKPGRGAALDE